MVGRRFAWVQIAVASRESTAAAGVIAVVTGTSVVGAGWRLKSLG